MIMMKDARWGHPFLGSGSEATNKDTTTEEVAAHTNILPNRKNPN